jgi:hypothetical protein
MRQSIGARLYSLVYQKVKSLALNQPFECDVSACYAPIIGPENQVMGLKHAWLVTVSIPNPVLGNPEIAASYPIQGVVPPNPFFEDIAQKLYESVMEQKDKALNPVPATAEMQAPVAPAAPAAPEKPRAKRDRAGVSHFPSKPGSELSA